MSQKYIEMMRYFNIKNFSQGPAIDSPRMNEMKMIYKIGHFNWA